MPLRLPVSLVVVDNVAHELTRRAIQNTLQEIDPDQVLILTDAPNKIAIPGAEYVQFYGNYDDAMRAVWYEVPTLVKAEHFLRIEWDSWVLDAERWTDEFLEYDYIGAPWPCGADTPWDRLGYRPGRNVGNGGFSLRSRRLARCLLVDRETFPFPDAYPEDDAICRLYRPRLEELGFRWAPEVVAERFSFECAPPPEIGTFGFHGCFNWPRILDRDKIEMRVNVASEYVSKNPSFVAMKRRMDGKEVTYNPGIFAVNSMEQARWVILNPDGVHTTEERWQVETEYLLGLIEPHLFAGAKILDYGCGIGRLAKPLIERHDCRVIGADISHSMLALSIEYVGSQRYIPCVPYVLDQLIEFGARCDFAIAAWTLQHCPRLDEDIARIKMALAPGGLLFVLNAERRSIPIEGGWADDGVDVWSMLKMQFKPISVFPVESVIIPDPPSLFGIFEYIK